MIKEWKNNKAGFNYFIEQEYEAGMILVGLEVKSIKDGRFDFSGSYVALKGEELYLRNLHISSWNNLEMQSKRDIKLLLNKSEIKKVKDAITIDRIAAFPTSIVVNKKGLIKLHIATGRGKKKADKRQTIIKRDAERKMKSGDE